MYVILIFYQVFYYQGTETQMKDSKYVPKSKRHMFSEKVISMKIWVMDKLKIAGESLVTRIGHTTRNKRLEGASLLTRPSPAQRHRKISIPIIALIALVMQAEGNRVSQQQQVRFDTDSEPIGIDNRCTGCISHRIEDFDGPLIDSGRAIKGFGGTKTMNVQIGTISWKWLDDEGVSHKFVIPRSFYVPSGNVRLLSPQHWAQTQKNNKNGTGTETLHDKVTLFWNGRKNKLTIPLGKQDNVATFHTAPGFRKFEAFCATAEINYAEEQINPIIAHETLVVTDDDEDESAKDSSNSTSKEPQREDWCKPAEMEFDFNLNGPQKQRPNIIKNEEQNIPTSAIAELLRFHHQFGHVSFKKLQKMAKMGTIPKRLAKCPIPACLACLYSKACLLYTSDAADE